MPDRVEDTGLEDGESALRRVPTQKRSRERVERMLEAAVSVISEKGSDALKMSEVARLSEVSIGSLYQYFPDKSAIIQTLAERYNAECRHCIEEALEPVESLDTLCTAFAALYDLYYDLFLAEPVIRDIRSGAQADKTLADMEIAESRRTGDILARAISRVAPGADAPTVQTACFAIMYMGEATVRLAASVEEEEGRRVVDTYKRMSLAEIRQLAGTG